jgi:hypothetical protein
MVSKYDATLALCPELLAVIWRACLPGDSGDRSVVLALKVAPPEVLGHQPACGLPGIVVCTT